MMRGGTEPDGRTAVSLGFVALGLAAILLSGCATDDGPDRRRSFIGRGIDPASRFATGRRPAPERIDPAEVLPDSPDDEPIVTATPTVTTHVRLAAEALGTVPYNGLTLPVPSPDQRYLACEVGDAPDWSTVLARFAADVPYGVHVDIYEAPTNRQPARRLHQMQTPALLGRSADQQGVLIEAPQDDGSRWIGKLIWTTGDIDWLVRNEQVNAFAAEGPRGELAYCRRNPDGRYFDLVVRHANGDESVLPADDGDWLMPVWGDIDGGLFVFRLERDGDLDAVFMESASAAAMEATQQTIPLAKGANRRSVYQSITGQTQVSAGPYPETPTLFFFHPARLRMCAWRPRAEAGRAVHFLRKDSFAALMDEYGAVLIATEDGLRRESLLADGVDAKMMSGVHIPRRTARSPWPYLLMSPRDGRLELTGMALAPKDP